MNTMKDDISREVESALGDEQASVDSAQRPLLINREGSGHTINVNDTTGALVLGAISVILLWSFLRSEARHRRLQAQLRSTE